MQELIIEPRVAHFAQLYVAAMLANDKINNPNATAIAVSVGVPKAGAGSVAAAWLQRADVQAVIRSALQGLVAETGYTLKDAIKRWVDIASADLNDVVAVRRVNCRHCHGVNHAYQWTAREYFDTCAKSMTKGDPLPDMEGGDGWRKNREPHPDCPECDGDGEESVYIADTRKLTGAARLLYAGVKQTRYGPEVQVHSQAEAVVNLVKVLGGFTERKEISGPNGGPIPIASLQMTVPVDPADAARLYQRLMEGKA